MIIFYFCAFRTLGHPDTRIFGASEPRSLGKIQKKGKTFSVFSFFLQMSIETVSVPTTRIAEPNFKVGDTVFLRRPEKVLSVWDKVPCEKPKTSTLNGFRGSPLKILAIHENHCEVENGPSKIMLPLAGLKKMEGFAVGDWVWGRKPLKPEVQEIGRIVNITGSSAGV